MAIEAESLKLMWVTVVGSAKRQAPQVTILQIDSEIPEAQKWTWTYYNSI